MYLRLPRSFGRSWTVGPVLAGVRLLGLCVLALVLGPLAATGLAGLAVMFGDVNPLDRSWLVRSFACVGTLAGVIAAVLIGIIGGIGQRGDAPWASTSMAAKQSRHPLARPRGRG